MVISILQQTKHFAVINKPPFVFSQQNTPHKSTARWDENRTVIELLNLDTDAFLSNPEPPYCKPRLVQRLDYGVSGAMIVATSMMAAQLFSRNLKFGGDKGWPIKKIYLALVEPLKDSPLVKSRGIRRNRYLKLDSRPDGSLFGEISKPLLIQRDDLEGNDCLTKYQVLSHLKDGTVLMALQPVTGRKHQLRRHCAEVLLAPVVGDVRYGYKGVTHSQQLALHSWRINYKAGLNWDATIAPILWGTKDLWQHVVDSKTGLVLPTHTANYQEENWT
ncbi:pseudouridine synthase [Lipomyces arxii]|uniref:pseudouridine synthase n=1 Tax=Lipomyces arxii TaxID=56418 RepID=UPI0034CE3E02